MGFWSVWMFIATSPMFGEPSSEETSISWTSHPSRGSVPGRRPGVDVAFDDLPRRHLDDRPFHPVGLAEMVRGEVTTNLCVVHRDLHPVTSVVPALRIRVKLAASLGRLFVTFGMFIHSSVGGREVTHFRLKQLSET
jgi:hypothetical protein